jgi:hypothetical protein
MDGHEEITMANKLRFTLPVLAAFLFVGVAPIMQAASGGIGGPKIIAAIPDYDLDVLIIYGTGLHNGETRPIVTIADVDRKVSVTEDGEVLVHDLNLISPGDYLLVLRPDHRVNVKAEMMVTLGAAGPPGSAGPIPAVYFVYTDDDLEISENTQASVRIFCHHGDVTIGGWFWKNPENTTRLYGGTGTQDYWGTFVNTQSDYSLRFVVNCLDFTEPRHSNTGEAADCDFEEGLPLGVDCLPPEH